MSQSKPSSEIPEIFDRSLRSLRRQRAESRMEKNGIGFFLDRAVDDLVDRLLTVTRQFERALIIGPEIVVTELRHRLPTDKFPKQITALPDLSAELETESFDLAVALFSLQSVNDLPGHMIRIRGALEPDGLFIAAIMGGDTLSEFRQSLYKTDDEIFGGLTARVHPMASYEQLAQLLTRCGFNLPVVDIDRIDIHYSGLDKLTGDLRDLGESNLLIARDKRPLSRDYKPALLKNYAGNFSRADGKLRASFEILWITGWTPHPDQQKPLKPGSAKMRLADALGVKESKI